MNTVKIRNVFKSFSACSMLGVALFAGACEDGDDCELTATCDGDGQDGGARANADADGSDGTKTPEPGAAEPDMAPDVDPGLGVGLRGLDAGTSLAPETDRDGPSGPADSGSEAEPDVDEPEPVVDAGSSAPPDEQDPPVPDGMEEPATEPSTDAGPSDVPPEPEPAPEPEPPPPEFSVGGEVSGLAEGATLVIEINGREVVVTANGPFAADGFFEGDDYSSEVTVQPEAQHCTVLNAGGQVGADDVLSIAITCVSDVATLSDLSIEGAELDAAFDPDRLDYAASVSLFTQGVTLSASVSDSDSTLHVRGNQVESGAVIPIALPVGTSSIDVAVTAVSGRIEIYTIDLTRWGSLGAPAQILTPSPDGAESFGHRLSASESFLFVDRDSQFYPGPEAFLFQLVEGTWAYLGDVEDLITDPVFRVTDGSVCGDVVAVTAVPSNGSATESLYVLEGGSGALVLEAAFTGLDPVLEAECDQDVIVVRSSSSTALFERGPGGWSAGPVLSTPDAASPAQPGRLAIDGDILVVGAPFESSAAVGIDGDPNYSCQNLVNCSQDSGAVYIFERNAVGQWQQGAYVKASNAVSGAQFGVSVDVSGETVVVGAIRDDSAFRGVTSSAPSYDCLVEPSSCSSNSGATYVYEKAAGGWQEVVYIKALDLLDADEFGAPVSIDGDLLVVGAQYDSGSAVSAGAAHVFHDDGSGWKELGIELAAPDAALDDNFPQQLVLGAVGVMGSAITRSSGQDKIYWFVD